MKKAIATIRKSRGDKYSVVFRGKVMFRGSYDACEAFQKGWNEV